MRMVKTDDDDVDKDDACIPRAAQQCSKMTVRETCRQVFLVPISDKRQMKSYIHPSFVRTYIDKGQHRRSIGIGIVDSSRSIPLRGRMRRKVVIVENMPLVIILVEDLIRARTIKHIIHIENVFLLLMNLVLVLEHDITFNFAQHMTR
jgi:hypothetical protein